ncbi:NCS1 family nucleobase:cation symporter [Bacillus sp. DTU_2020_1000418_1_SI_GHA_SEK_038]|uniref:NCS1 family nucleobase:cation symporter n=1 Tax=Bacillus sp. DTU_2020_1000418_1_SI_GHA_SEK_038 TaxID=3077585 RepID=UPI0028E3112E|nr:NCS1 family nucleobase:cation symporter [Bacillus sp. DTU_2020_1000418_1_SI_GHA_SEK_038]WNS76229.1 NCS1 family nucleobase:cation symporter [Bacillus sp. DTU_2020_1000418_1_SI_GHA_SEK_038]
MNYDSEKGISLTGKDIMPTTDNQRNISTLGFLVLWIGIAVQLVTFIAAAQLYPALSPTQIIIACILGNLVVALLLTLLGDIGIKYGIPYAVYIRACFGYLGAHIPAVVRAIPAIFWFGFQTWMGAYALNVIMEMLTGYSNLMMLIIVFGAVQIINTAMGIEAITKFEWLASPSILIIGILLQVFIMNQHDLTFSDIFAKSGEGGVSMGFAVVVMMGTYITMALNAPDFTRFLKTNIDKNNPSWWKENKGSFIGHTFGLVGSMLLFTIIGLTSGVATGNWNPIDVMVQTMGQDNPWLLIVCLAFVILAQWSTNISANLLPPGYIIVNFFPRKITFVTGSIIAGVLGLLLQPWNYADYVPQILMVITATLAPIVGIMFTDYYFLRKRQVNVDELYKAEGQYKYWYNVNPAAIIAYIPAGLSVLLFPDYGFVSALLIATVLYYTLMKYWICKVYEQPEITNTNFKVDHHEAKKEA